MIFYIICEPCYAASSWCNKILEGILSEKRSKRFSAVIIDSIDEINNFPQSDDDAIFITGSDDIWLETVIDKCENRFGKNIIVIGNFEHCLEGKSYSIVSSDISADTFELLSYLRAYKKEKIAFYGANPRSASDKFRYKCFLQFGGMNDDIYFNNANLNNCFNDFFPKLNKYDAVLCANDYCAVSLIRHLNERNAELPFIASCGESHLSKIFSPSITNLKLNYTDFGKSAVNLYKVLHSGNKTVKVNLISEISVGDTTNNLPFKPYYPEKENRRTAVCDLFYSDKEVSEMMLIENLLSSCDETELAVLRCIVNGMTYTEIAEKFFMSVNGIKYKAKKMFDMCGMGSKNEFLSLAKKFIFFKSGQRD